MSFIFILYIFRYIPFLIMANETYFVFRDFIKRTYYTLNDVATQPIEGFKEKIDLKTNDKYKYLYFDNTPSNDGITNINNFLFKKAFIKQSYNNNNITYIIYKENEALLTIRKLVNDDAILYILEIDTNKDGLSNLISILEKSKESIKVITNGALKHIYEIYEKFKIQDVLEY